MAVFPARVVPRIMYGMRPLELLAPAKVNLVLRVGPVEPNGFHPLASWMCTVALFDKLTVARSSQPGVSFRCDDPAMPTGTANLVVRAANRLMNEASLHQACAAEAGGASSISGVSISLEKRIPPAAGLGGGSSDAAATLVAINQLLEHQLSRARLVEEAAALGSDVPFFFAAPSAWCTGRGEKTLPLAPPRVAQWVMLAFPSFGLSTAAVYRRLDELRTNGSSALNSLEYLQPPVDLSEYPDLPARSLLGRLQNDLETPAFDLRPELGDLRQSIERKIDRPVRMSGSGSTLFSLFDTEAEAVATSAAVNEHFGVRVLPAQLAPAPF
ncbi:MAG TPA: 4-(cytidine 5'-diphospho)-2-C-methyl-D-erythritol kinase [Tepidisphaeraceae bacterium]|nr:4-(cytidine 5'-diphospho)-2-C-methyl-D-erythritol kinase [Tepidisphaeraceae bacterium]